MIIGLIRERKNPPDTRVAFTPKQCRHLLDTYPQLKIVVEPSPNRCFPDKDYEAEGIPLSEDLSHCDVLLGIKEVPVENLIPGKTYFFFSHTIKKQPYNQKLARAFIKQQIRMVDYETLTWPDGKRVLGFGVFAGIVGAHNGIMTWGRKNAHFNLLPAHELGSMEKLQEAYNALKIPPVKIAVTGSGRVAAGILQVMEMLDIASVEPEDFLEKDFDYPVYTHLKGAALYAKEDGSFHRDEFHQHPERYHSLFHPYLKKADILMNGIFWNEQIVRLFEKEEVKEPDFRCAVIADITCDVDGSVPLTTHATDIADPVYALDRHTLQPVAPFQPGTDTIDLMTVDNLPNELPRDASQHFGSHLEKYVIPELLKKESDMIERATITAKGRLMPRFEYLGDYAY